LDKKIRYTLSRNEKLKGRKAIEQLFSAGKAFTISPFRVVYFIPEETEGEILQAGFTVSTKYFKKAVDRNRVKRLLREAYRLQKHILIDDLTRTDKRLRFFIIYTGNELPEYNMVYERVTSILNRFQKIINA
jgi:ribonuclease P protein component